MCCTYSPYTSASSVRDVRPSHSVYVGCTSTPHPDTRSPNLCQSGHPQIGTLIWYLFRYLRLEVSISVAKTTRYLLAVHVLLPLSDLVGPKCRRAGCRASLLCLTGSHQVCGLVLWAVQVSSPVVLDYIRTQSVWLGYHLLVWGVSLRGLLLVYQSVGLIHSMYPTGALV